MTHRQPLDRIHAYLCTYRAQHGYAPDLREIVAACGLSSTSTAALALRRLAAQGRITVTPGVARSAVPTCERRSYED